MVNQPFKVAKHKTKTARKLKKGDTVTVMTAKGKRVKVGLNYVKKPGHGSCLRGHVKGGHHKGKKISLSRKEVR